MCDDGLRGTTAGLFLWASVTEREKEEEENFFSGGTPVGKLQLHSGEEEEATAEAAVTDR